MLFDDNFNPQSTRKQGGDYFRIANIGLQASKNTLNSPIKSWRSIFIKATLNIIFKYTNDYGSFNTKKKGNIKKLL